MEMEFDAVTASDFKREKNSNLFYLLFFLFKD